MSTTPNYSAVIGDYTLTEIQSISLRLSMSELADSFTLVVSDRFGPLRGDHVEISIEGRVVLVGEVMTVRLSKSPGVRDLTITGFSAAQRLVKGSLVIGDGIGTKAPKDFSLEDLCTQAVKPFGIVVDVAASAADIAAEKIDKVKVKPGQKVYDFISDLAKRQGCILISGTASVGPDREAKSSIRITRVAVRESPFPLVFPSARCEAIDYEDDARAVHSQYLVTRRGGGTRDDDGTLKGLDGVADDERVPYSPLIIQTRSGGRSQRALDRQAEWEMRKRAAEGQRVSMSWVGWSPNNGEALWKPNTVFRVVDTEEGFDQLMVLISVDLASSVGGAALARLELIPPDAYAILEEPKIKKRKRRRGPKGLLETFLGGGFTPSKEWLIQHSGLANKSADNTDVVDFDAGAALGAFFKPDDPDA